MSQMRMPAAASHRRAVLVLGPFRTGSSLVCRLLDRLGVCFGPPERLGAADWENPLGYYERGDVNHANGRLLETAGRSVARPGCPRTLPDEADLSVLADVDLAWTTGKALWALKDPRFCATLGAWVAAGRLRPDDLRVVLTDRDEEAIVRSAARCSKVAHFFGGDRAALEEGVRTYRSLARRQADRLGAPVVTVRYERLVRGEAPVIAELAAFVGATDPAGVERARAEVGKGRARLRFLAGRVRRGLARRFASVAGTRAAR